MERGLVRKLVVVVFILVLVVLFKVLGLDQYLTLDYLKAQQAAFAALYHAHPAAVIAAYAGIYIAVTALSLPGAAIMTLAGGAMFGLAVGTIIVSLAATIGATLACLASRYLLRDWVQKKFADHLVKINEGMKKEGGFYLFSLRLVPVFPFFVINLVMGLTTISLRTFFLVSLVGMLPGTVVFVNAGRELARINSPGDILSPEILLSFALLGLLPVIARKILPLLHSRASQAPPEE
jgi:uncharacterized membrane protein YdjX (TVP38/TMEM64 family)